MQPYTKKIETTWANADANGHLRNTAYSELAIHARLACLHDLGMPFARLQELKIGPVLLHEDIFYYREINILENVTATCAARIAAPDFRTFSFEQHILNEAGDLSATLIVEGLWMDLETRKPIVPPAELREVCAKIPRTENFIFSTERFIRRKV